MGRYFKYAIGEILLVVIGILIALQINNWNEQKKQTQVEVKILKQLKKDLLSNIGDLKLNLSLQEKGVQSCKILLKHMESAEPFHDSLGKHFANSFLWSKFTANSGAYENLKSRGVELISNQELREYILIIYEQNFKWNESYENIIINSSELMRHEHAHKFFSELSVIEYDNGFRDGNAKIINYDQLRQNNHFKFFLTQFINDTQYQIDAITKKYIQDHELVVSMIEDELNEN